MKNCLNLSIASALLLAAGSVSAATLSITPTPATAPAGGGATNPTPLQVAYDNAGTTADSIEFEITFDETDLNLTVAAAPGISCSYVADSGLVTVVAFDAGSNTIASGNLCALTFTATAGAANGESFPLAFQNVLVSDGGGAATAPTTTDGAINIVDIPADPTNIGFNPQVVNLANGGNVAGQQSAATVVSVTTIAGSGVDPGSYSCTVPAGFQLTNAAQAGIPAGSDPADISVTCTLAAAAFSDTSVCTVNSGADPAVNLTLNCPTPAGPVLESTPPTGTPLTCNGTPGSATTTSVTISNTGTADMTGVTCNVTAGFTIQSAPSPTVVAGASTSVVVGCTPPADLDPPTTGTLTCTTTAPAGGTLTFPVSSDGVVVVAPSQPETIPTTSLWAKIGLVGLLAALGMLLVGFRRQH